MPGYSAEDAPPIASRSGRQSLGLRARALEIPAAELAIAARQREQLPARGAPAGRGRLGLGRRGVVDVLPALPAARVRAAPADRPRARLRRRRAALSAARPPRAHGARRRRVARRERGPAPRLCRRLRLPPLRLPLQRLRLEPGHDAGRHRLDGRERRERGELRRDRARLAARRGLPAARCAAQPPLRRPVPPAGAERRDGGRVRGVRAAARRGRARRLRRLRPDQLSARC